MAKTIKATSISNLSQTVSLDDNDLFVVSKDGAPKNVAFGSLKSMLDTGSSISKKYDTTVLAVDKKYDIVELPFYYGDYIQLTTDTDQSCYYTHEYISSNDIENIYCKVSLYTQSYNSSQGSIRSLDIEVSPSGDDNEWYSVASIFVNPGVVDSLSAVSENVQNSYNSLFNVSANIVVGKNMHIRGKLSEIKYGNSQSDNNVVATGSMQIVAVSDSLSSNS